MPDFVATFLVNVGRHFFVATFLEKRIDVDFGNCFRFLFSFRMCEPKDLVIATSESATSRGAGVAGSAPFERNQSWYAALLGLLSLGQRR